MKKRILSAIAASLFVLTAATSCGGNTTASTSNSDGATSTKGGKTITYWAMWNENESQATVYKQAISKYEAATGNKVSVQWSGRDVRKTLKSALDSGQKIDIIENSPDWLYPNLGTQYLSKLDSYMKKTYPTTNGKAFKDTLLPAITKFAATYASDGSYYYVPNQPSITALFYNKDIFKNAGVTTIPKTWSEFLAACEKIKAKGIAPLTVDDAYYALLYSQYLAEMKGDKWTSELVTDKTGEKWGDAAVLQMAKAFSELYQKGYFSKTTGSNVFPAAQQEVALGTAAMYLNGSWFPNEVAGTTGPNFNWGVMPFPDLPGASEKNTKLCLISQGFGISSKSENPDDAFELITYLMSSDSQQQLADKAACIPATVGTNWPKQLVDAKTMFDNMTGTFKWAGGMDADADFSAIINTDFAKLISGKMTPEQFVSDIKAKAKR